MMDLFKPSYFVGAYCENCGETTEIRIPKGIYIYDHLKRKECKCFHCGCRIRTLLNRDLNPDRLEEDHKEELQKIREKIDKMKSRPKFLKPIEEGKI